MSITHFLFCLYITNNFLVAEPISTFASWATDIALSITLYLMNLSRMVHKMSWRHSAINDSIGLSLWNTSRNGHSILATVRKEWQFSFDKGIIYMPLQTDKAVILWNLRFGSSTYLWYTSSYYSISLLLSQQHIHPFTPCSTNISRQLLCSWKCHVIFPLCWGITKYKQCWFQQVVNVPSCCSSTSL